MTDRTPTKVLENGALRYGGYDETGKLLRHEYFKAEDDPTDPGTPVNKATLLSDDTAAALDGVGTVNEALSKLSPAALIARDGSSILATDVFGNIVGGFGRVEYGGYIGTGTYGSANPNTITLPFEAKLLIINAGSYFMFMVKGGNTATMPGTASTGFTCPCTFNGFFASWSNTSSADRQLNATGVEYIYYAFG